MKKTAAASVVAFVLSIFVTGASCAETVRHYVFFNMERERIAEPAFLAARSLEGAQLKYTWKELEPERDRYDFGAIQHDLDFLRSRGKRLFIQIQDASFDAKTILVPRYLLEDAQYHGGADMEFEDDEKTPAGWVARRWDPAVRDRFHRLLAALGRRFDGKIEGINLPETSIEFGESGRRFPKGFTPVAYRDAVIDTMKALKRAFPGSTCIQYANFMPGEFLPWTDRSLLRSVYRSARALGVGVGGPDVLPYKKSQMGNSYGLIRSASARTPVGMAVQDGNYEHVDPRTGKRVTIVELLAFARDYLGADYLFWCTQEPYYSKELMPFLRGEGRDPVSSLEPSGEVALSADLKVRRLAP
ncbi:MAG: hypothetical protein HY815_05275 [Candidatus Riflebacteria bacterium]|nr:hypothetical protein [Candidatus Riflebacteria bacterium]